MSVQDETTPAQNDPVAEDSNQPTPPVDESNTSVEPAPDGEAEQAPVSEPAAEEPGSEAERKPSRAERRIREQNAEIKELRSRVSQTGDPSQDPSLVQPSPQLERTEEGEVTPDQLDQYVAQRANQVAGQQVSFAIAQERAKNNFDHDVETLPTLFPEIEDIPGLEAKISQEYQDKAFKIVGVDPVSGKPQYALDPSVRLADVAKENVDVVRAAAKKYSAANQEAEEAQADSAAIPPSGGGARPEKSLDDMSIDELTAKVGYHNG